MPPTAALRALLPRAEVDVDAVVERVRPIVEAVRERGVEAALEFSERFDRVRPAAVRVPARELTGALDALDPAVRAALETSIERAARCTPTSGGATSSPRSCPEASSPSGSFPCGASGCTRRAGWRSTRRRS